MKTKKFNHKLQLGKVTLVNLNSDSMSNALGGVLNYSDRCSQYAPRCIKSDTTDMGTNFGACLSADTYCCASQFEACMTNTNCFTGDPRRGCAM